MNSVRLTLGFLLLTSAGWAQDRQKRTASPASGGGRSLRAAGRPLGASSSINNVPQLRNAGVSRGQQYLVPSAAVLQAEGISPLLASPDLEASPALYKELTAAPASAHARPTAASVQAVSLQVQDVRGQIEAHRSPSSGWSGSVGGVFRKIFDFEKKRDSSAAGPLPGRADASLALPDVQMLGRDVAIARTLAQAQTAFPPSLARLYAHAEKLALEETDPRKKAGALLSIQQQALAAAPVAMPELARGALSLATRPERAEEARGLLGGLEAVNRYASGSGPSYLGGLDALKKEFTETQRIAAERPGVNLSAAQVDLKPAVGRAGLDATVAPARLIDAVRAVRPDFIKGLDVRALESPDLDSEAAALSAAPDWAAAPGATAGWLSLPRRLASGFWEFVRRVAAYLGRFFAAPAASVFELEAPSAELVGEAAKLRELAVFGLERTGPSRGPERVSVSLTRAGRLAPEVSARLASWDRLLLAYESARTAAVSPELAAALAREFELLTGEKPASGLSEAELPRYVESMRQRATSAVLRGRVKPNAVMVFNRDGAVVSMPVLDRVSMATNAELAPAAAALGRAVLGGFQAPPGSFALGEREIWHERALLSGRASLYVRLLPADSGGLIHLRWIDDSRIASAQAKRRFLQRVLEELGLSMNFSGATLTAWADRDHQALPAWKLADAFAVILNALDALDAIERELDALLAGSFSSKDNERTIDALARVVLDEGRLPFLRPGVSWVSEWRRFQTDDRALHAARANLVLGSLGLAPLPVGRGYGERTLELHFHQPIESAVALGRVAARPSGNLVPNLAYDPLGSLASAALQNGLSAAPLSDAIEPSAATRRIDGRVGRLLATSFDHPAASGQRVVWRALRDEQTGRALFAQFEISNVRGGRKRLTPGEARALFHKMGYRTPAVVAAASPVAAMREKPEPSDPGLMTAYGVTLFSPEKDPSPVNFKVTYALREIPGGLFASPYIRSGDKDAAQAGAFLITQGGATSQSAQTARELGRPLVMMPGAVWRPQLTLSVALFGEAQPGPQGTFLQPVESYTAWTLRQGAEITLDSRSGSLSSLPR